MSALETLALALGTSFASGLNLYATVAALGLLHRFGVFRLPPSLEVLADPVVLGIAIGLYVIEFIADKIPYVDTIWDVVHTFIRPLSAAVLAYGALGDVAESWRVGAALLAGGVALTSHGTKATARAAANASPEPVSNWIFSFLEDAVAVLVTWLAVSHPFLTVGVVVLLIAACLLLLVKLYRFLRQKVGAFLGGGAERETRLPSRPS